SRRMRRPHASRRTLRVLLSMRPREPIVVPLAVRRFHFEAYMIVRSLEEALAVITDGCVLAVPREASGIAMAATRALIRRGVRRLSLVTLPTSSLQADLLIGAGCVAAIETSAVSLGEFGAAPRFVAAVTAGVLRIK